MRAETRRLRARLRAAAALAVICGLAISAPLPAAQAVDSGAQENFDGAFVTPAADAEREAQLVQAEDQRLIDIRIASARRKPARTEPYRVRSSGFDTLVLPGRPAAYTLNDLRRLAPETFLLQRDGSYLLREHILVDVGATLQLAATKPTTIKMLSSSDGFVSIVTHGGRLQLLGTAAAPLTFTSWDQTNSTVDNAVTDGRAYILAEGQLVAKHITAAHLGFWSGRTGGLAVTSSAVSNSEDDGQVVAADTDPLGAVVGQVTNSNMIGNAFGFFATGASGLKLSNDTISDSLVDGLVLHRNVTSAEVEQVRVENSGADGIVVTRGVEDALLSHITSSGNGRDGVSITGKPLAAGPSPSGASVRQFGNNLLKASLVENNARTGVRIVGGTKVQLLGNSVNGGVQGILVADGAAGVTVRDNRISDVNGSGIQIRDSTRVSVSDNTLRRDVTGMHVMNGMADIFKNTVAEATRHAITMVGDVEGTELNSNLLSGHGSSAIDLARVSDSEPVIKANDTRGWDRTLTKDAVLSALEHPLTAIWLVVGILLLIGQVVLRRRRRQAPRPYLDGPAQTRSAAAIEADQHAALLRAPVPDASLTTAPTGIGLIDVPAELRRRSNVHHDEHLVDPRSGEAETNAPWPRNVGAL